MADLTQMSDADLLAAYNAAKQTGTQPAATTAPTDLQSMSDADLLKAYNAATPVTAKNRAHAAEGGILGGLAYTATAIPDAAMNVYNLGKAGLGAGYQAITGKPGWDVGEPFPVGHWLTSQMDKTAGNPYFDVSTGVERPDDAASRYLNTAGNVAGGVIAGSPGSNAAQLARSLAVATPPAIAGRYVAESKPFDSDAANNAASILTQALGTRVTGGLMRPRGELLPENQIKNDAVTEGQEAGYVFPPGTTNPTGGNVALETIAGKTSLAQNMAVKNQKVTNEGARADMGLPPGKGAPISDLEIATAKAKAAPGYDALRGAGTINAPADFPQRLDAALSKQSGAGALSSKLADPELAGIVDELKGKTSFDAGNAMDAIAALRDKASTAYRSGNSQAGQAYKGVSKVIEDAINTDLTNRGGSAANLVSDFQNSRQKFAIINSAEENRNATTGNVVAPKLAAALKKGDYLSGKMEIAGRAAGQAEKSGAFAEPTKTAGNHLGLLGALVGGTELTKFLPENWEHAGMGALAATAAVPAARAGARQYLYTLGQRNALPRSDVPIVNPSLLGGSYASALSNVNR